MKTPVIRPATADDVKIAARMARQMYEDNVHRDPGLQPTADFEQLYQEQLRQIITGDEPGAVFVAEASQVIGVVEGTILHWPYLVCERRGFVSMLYVDPSWRRQGLGTRLFLEIKDWYRNYGPGITRLELNFLDGNATAEQFWLRQGFTHMPQRRLLLQ